MNPQSPRGMPLQPPGRAACPQAAAGAVGTPRPTDLRGDRETELELSGARILVVDDVAANRDLLGQTLEAAGFSVSAAPTGEVALDVARARS